MDTSTDKVFARFGIAAAALAALLAIALSFVPAWADEDEAGLPASSQDELSRLQEQIEATAFDYDTATARVAELEGQMAETQTRIDEINNQLPAQQEKSVTSVKALYFLQQEGFGLVEMMLASDSITDFLQAYEYVDYIHQHNTAQLKELENMQTELAISQKQLEQDSEEAVAAANRAEQALEDAKSAREQAKQKALAEAAQQLARQQALAQAAAGSPLAAAAGAQNAAQANAGAAQNAQNAQANAAAGDAANASGDAAAQPAEQAQAQPAEQGVDAGNTESPVLNEVSTEPATGVVAAEDVPVTDRDAFIAEWTGRIDAYLAGSPMAGQGATFATAAWNYGVDPRWSPAIACAESGKGSVCFLPYNAWGWGSSSWGSWEAAINDHVAGLARGYGYTITYDAAAKYCPPNADHWYNTVLSQMNSI